MIGIHQRCAGEKESGRKKNNAPQATLTSPAFDLRNNVSVGKGSARLTFFGPSSLGGWQKYKFEEKSQRKRKTTTFQERRIALPLWG